MIMDASAIDCDYTWFVWIDRFFSSHSLLFYYYYDYFMSVCVFFLPSIAVKMSEVRKHWPLNDICERIILTLAGAKTSVYIYYMCVICMTNSTLAYTHIIARTLSLEKCSNIFIRPKCLQNVYHCNLFWSNLLGRSVAFLMLNERSNGARTRKSLPFFLMYTMNHWTIQIKYQYSDVDIRWR